MGEAQVGGARSDSASASGRPSPVNSVTFRAFWLFGRALMRVMFRMRVEGRPRLRGGYVVVANHVSRLDPIMLGAASVRRIRFMMSVAFYESPGARWFYRWNRAIPVSPAGGNREALRAAREALGRGEVVGVFPEGGISRDGQLVLGNPGAVALVLGAGVPIVPAAIVGAFEALPPGRWPRFSKVTVRFGAPIPNQELAPAGADRKTRLARATRRIMDEIARLAGQESREEVLERAGR